MVGRKQFIIHHKYQKQNNSLQTWRIDRYSIIYLYNATKEYCLPITPNHILSNKTNLQGFRKCRKLDIIM